VIEAHHVFFFDLVGVARFDPSGVSTHGVSPFGIFSVFVIPLPLAPRSGVVHVG
jgi:hypothetical protein